MTFRNITLLALITLTGACGSPLPADAVIGNDDDTTETDGLEAVRPDNGDDDTTETDGTDGGDTDGTDGTTDGTDDGACAVEYVLSWEPTAYGDGRNLAYADNGDLWIADGDSLDDADSDVPDDIDDEPVNTTLLEIEVTDCDGPSQNVNGSFVNSGDVPAPEWAAGIWWVCSFDDLDNMGYYGTFYVDGVKTEPMVFGVDVNGDGVYTGAGGDEVGCHFELAPEQ